MQPIRSLLIFISMLGWACAGPEGPPGPAGMVGPPGVADYTVVTVDSKTDATRAKQVRASCPDGLVATGAGWSVLDPSDAILEGRATYFLPAYDGSHWLVNATNDSGFAPEWKLRVRVLCARVVGDVTIVPPDPHEETT